LLTTPTRHLDVEGLDISRLPALVLAAFIGGIVAPCGGFETRALRVIGVTAAPRLFADFVRDFTLTPSVEEFAINLS
jgi:hypothetical protein